MVFSFFLFCDLSIGFPHAERNVLKDERGTIRYISIQDEFLVDYYVGDLVFRQQSVQTGFDNRLSTVLDSQLAKDVTGMRLDGIQ